MWGPVGPGDRFEPTGPGLNCVFTTSYGGHNEHMLPLMPGGNGENLFVGLRHLFESILSI